VVAVKKLLEPYLPSPVISRTAEGTFHLISDRPQSIRRVRAFYGNFGMAAAARHPILRWEP
jgi:glycine dehydrogenase subunit 2